MSSVSKKWIRYTAGGAALVSAAMFVAVGPVNVANQVMSAVSNFSADKSNDYLIQTWVTSPDGVRRLKNQYYADSGQIVPPSESYYDAGPGTYIVQVSVENAGVKQWSEKFSVTVS